MRYITNPDFHLENTAVALGKFEGIHRGHQLLLDEIKKYKKEGLCSTVFTFDLPPKSVLKGDLSYQQIYTKEERHILLENQGIDILIEHPFTKEFASLTPEAFVREVLVKKAGAKKIVVGSDFRFGKKRSGSISDLKKWAEECGYQLIVKEKLQMDHEDVSSTRIRTLLKKGCIEEANELIGRPYCVIGKVVHGKALGRTISVPTINQIVKPGKMVPPNGVYVTRVHVADRMYYGITNVGVKPTVEKDSFKGIETNIFDFNEDLYGQTIAVEFLHYRRPEFQFESIDALKEQLRKDIDFGKSYIEKLG